MKNTLLLLLFTLSINTVFADSPLTSTDFGGAYLDIPIVHQAFSSKGSITNEMMEYIDDDTNPLDVKLAIINSLGWDHKGMMISKIFFMYVINKKKYKDDFGGDYIAFKWYATSDELICYAYMRAMDNYFDVVEVYAIAGDPLGKSPASFDVKMTYNLIKSK